MMKQKVGEEIAKKIKSGQVVGIGTGSTVDAAITAIAFRVKTEKIDVKVVPTSYQTAQACHAAGLIVLSPVIDVKIDFGFDGADAVDKNRNAIKGKGAAMLEEKILAAKCSEYFLIIDESKLCEDICQKSYVPVEIVPSALGIATRAIQKLGAIEINPRSALPGKHGAVVTERGNLILDCTFSNWKQGLEHSLKCIVGVVDTGLFEGYATQVIVAGENGITIF